MVSKSRKRSNIVSDLVLSEEYQNLQSGECVPFYTIRLVVDYDLI